MSKAGLRLASTCSQELRYWFSLCRTNYCDAWPSHIPMWLGLAAVRPRFWPIIMILNHLYQPTVYIHMHRLLQGFWQLFVWLKLTTIKTLTKQNEDVHSFYCVLEEVKLTFLTVLSSFDVHPHHLTGKKYSFFQYNAHGVKWKKMCRNAFKMPVIALELL